MQQLVLTVEDGWEKAYQKQCDEKDETERLYKKRKYIETVVELPISVKGAMVYSQGSTVIRCDCFLKNPAPLKRRRLNITDHPIMPIEAPLMKIDDIPLPILNTRCLLLYHRCSQLVAVEYAIWEAQKYLFSALTYGGMANDILTSKPEMDKRYGTRANIVIFDQLCYFLTVRVAEIAENTHDEYMKQVEEEIEGLIDGNDEPMTSNFTLEDAEEYTEMESMDMDIARKTINQF
jgi:hypothetical protein